MPTYTLEIEAFGVYSTDIPSLEIWTDGSLDSTHSITSSGSTISVTITYGGALPSSLALTFDDGFAEPGRTIEIQSVKINDKYVNTGNYLSSDSLVKTASATVDISGADFIFDSSDPAASNFTPVTYALTAGNDTYRNYDGTVHVLDGLAGNDRIYLGSGADRITGGAGNDRIFGGDGNDLLYGAGDNDKLEGQGGDDELYGGTGNDRIHGGTGDDEIHGGAGNDRLNGHDDDDVITGGAGDDYLHGGDGTDYLFGGDDNDSLVGGIGNDTLDGGAGNDILYGGAGIDIMNGGDDNDILVGDDGADVISGDDGDDTIYGGDDNDEIYGGNNDDYLNGEVGNDTLDGEAGVDVIVGADGADTISGGAGADILHGSGLTRQEVKAILDANPNVVFNADTNSFYQYVNTGTTRGAAETAASTTLINGVAGHLVNITSQVENDYIESLLDGGATAWTSGSGLGDADPWFWNGGIEDGVQFSLDDVAVNNMYESWLGGEPNDTSGTEVYARIRQSDGNWTDRPDTDTLHYVIEWDAGLLSDDLAIDTINGGDGNDFIYGYGGDDVLNGDADDDVIIGGAGDDTINGGTGDDALFGGDGDDVLTGGDGADTIYADQTATSSSIRNTLSTEILSDNPVLYYKMDETSGTTITNYGSLGSAVDGTLSGTYTLDDTDQYLVSGGAIDFEGSSLLDVPDSASINTAAHTVRSVELVFTADSTTGRQMLYEEGGNTNALNIYLDGANIYFNIRDAGEYGPFTITTSITAGVTYHAAVTFDSVTTNLFTGYLDGAVVGTGVTNTDLDSHGGDIGIGNVNGSSYMHDGTSSGNYYFDGRISDVAIYNSVLSAPDIQERADIVAQLAATDTNTIHDGDGLDTLYASDEADIFVFDSANATNDTDIIEYFSAGHGDQLDISDLLTGFVLGTSDINDFVQLTEAGGNTTIAIDGNGTAGGSSYADIVQINGVTGMDADMMLANEVLIT